MIRTVGSAALVVGALVASFGVGESQRWRTVALASFDDVWQTIHDSFHDPTFGGLDWQGVREELRPQAEAAQSPDDVRDAIRAMLARLERSHFALLSASRGDALPSGPALVPIELRVTPEGPIIVAVEPGSSADRAGLRPGMRLESVADQTAEHWRAEAAGASVRARDLEVWRQASASLRGLPGSEVTVRVTDADSEPRAIRVTRERERGISVKLGNLPELHIRVESRSVETATGKPVGVIGFNTWMSAAGQPVGDAVDRFRDASGLVFDLRGNMGGLLEMIRGIAGHVLDQPVSLGRMQTRQAELQFFANPRRSTQDGRSVEPFSGPVAVLVDELTASASECFAGGLQSLGRARIFGRPTMGQALPAVTRRLPNGDVLMYSVGDFVTADGTRLEGTGVVPDVVVPLSRRALAAGRDEVLDAALRWMARQEG